VASDQTTQDLIDAAAAVELEQLFTTVCGNGSMLPGITQGKQKLTAIYPAKEIGDRLIRRCCEVVDHFYHTVTTDGTI
jgi:hypothetical protein